MKFNNIANKLLQPHTKNWQTRVKNLVTQLISDILIKLTFQKKYLIFPIQKKMFDLHLEKTVTIH